MPRRTIVLGRQPTSFDFQDDHGPLVNGLAYAAGQWLASGRDRAQIEMQGDAAAAEEARRSAEHADNLALRQEDLSLRRLALGQQDEDRQAVRRQTQVRDAANAAEAWRDDMGGVVKFGFDNLIGRFMPKSGSGTPSPSTDLNREKFFWDRAVQEVGNPDHDLEVVESTDLMGNPVKREVRRPLTAEQRAQRVRLINQRFDELRGVAAPPASAPVVPPPPAQLPHRQMVPYTPEMQDDYQSWRGAQPNAAPSITQSALGAPAPVQALPTPSTSEHARAQFMQGAGGFGMFPGTNFITPQASAPNAGQPPAAQPAQDPRAVFIQQSGVNPDPSTGITVDDFVGADDQRRVAALRTLPPNERLKAIATLRAMGFQ
jgi:hypothetical protein